MPGTTRLAAALLVIVASGMNCIIDLDRDQMHPQDADGRADSDADGDATPAVCGNGDVEEGEECDTVTPRSCDTTCATEGVQICTACAWDTCTAPAETCDGVDNDCDTETDEGGAELCDAADNDCDTETDEADADGCTPYYLDSDGDEHGVGTETRCLCAGTAPYTGLDALDCNDVDVTAYPGAPPVACSAQDHDCNGHADADNDADGRNDIRCPGGDDCNDGNASAWSGGWYDATTGYLWETSPSSRPTFGAAVGQCNGSTVCGYAAGSWHLPTISELRSLIRGCPGTATGGACNVTDSCTGDGCGGLSCEGCALSAGPGTDGCYWDVALSGSCGWYWSSSLYSEDGPPWGVYFYWGRVYFYGEPGLYYVRCVHHLP